MSVSLSRRDKLRNAYPRIFGEGLLGFEHGEGWLRILEAMCARIDMLLQTQPGARLHVHQVKEKFGYLHFYYATQGMDKTLEMEIREAVGLAEQASLHVCEECGNPGVLDRTRSWIRTLCHECRQAAM